jgi:gas vesicle protein
MRTFLFGLILGAVAGVMYAPATGNRTRSLVRDKVTRYRNDTADFLDRKSRDLSNRMQGVRHKAADAMETVRERAREQSTRVQGAVDRGLVQAREQMSQVRDQVQETIKEKQDQIQRSA